MSVRLGEGAAAAAPPRPRHADPAQRRSRRIWQAVSGAVAAVLAQGLTAVGSVLVQVLAARELGAAGYGTFTVINGVLLVVLAVQNGWVGDSLTVLDRWDADTRSALTVSLLGFLVAGAAGCTAAALALGESGSVPLAVGLMAVAYLCAEFCRRLFMARQSFWALSANNLVFVCATWAVLVVQPGRGLGGLGGLALAVAAGSGVAVAVAVVQLPLAEFRPGRLSTAGLAELSRFAVWRAGQIGLRPLALLGVRVVVAAVAGRAAVGQLEAARLLMAPATTFVQGVGSFLLPSYSAEARGETRRRTGVARVTGAVVGVALALSALPLLFPEQAHDLLTSGSFDIPRVAVVGWALYALAFAAGLPSASYLVAQRRSRTVLLARLVDAGVGLASAALLAVAVTPEAAPYGLAFGALVGAALTLRSSRGLPAPAPAAVAPRVLDLTTEGPRTRRTPLPLTPRGRRRRLLVPGVTLPLAALAMMVSSDDKFRVRPLGQSLSASPDLNTLAEIGVYAVAFAVLVRALLHTRARVSAATPLLFLAQLYCVYMCVSAAWAVYPPLAVVRGWQFLVTAALVTALARFGSRVDLHRLAQWYVVTAACSVVLGRLVHFPRLRLMQDRFTWLYVHPVIAGTWLGLAVVITLWLLLTRHERPGLPRLPVPVLLAVLALCAGGLVATQTRGALGGCTAGVAVLLLVRYRSQLAAVVALGAVAVAAVAVLFSPVILTFLARGESAQELTSFNGRTPLWDQAYHLVLERPITGYGTTASRGLFFDTVGLGGAHNAPINVLVDGGLIGLALWAAVLVGIVRLLRPLLRTAAGRVDVPLLAAVLTYLLVNGVTTEGLGFVANVSSLWLFVVVGWVAVLCRRTREVS